MSFPRVIIFSASFDPLGFLSFALTNDAGLRDVGRRVNITPTLDGSVAVDDAGATDSDRAFALTLKPRDELEAEQIKYLTQNFPTLRLAMKEGLFQVVPLSASFTDIQCTWNLRVVAKLA